MKSLVIVESPGKIIKIQKYLNDLGKDKKFIVKASFGHIRDLDSSHLSIDIDNNFKQTYIINKDKRKVVKELKEIAKCCDEVIIASDEDREGEKIGADLAHVLKLKNPKRIVFHEITKNAIMKAVDNPTTINKNMVYAQQARRLLDRLVGYTISPLIWANVIGGKSAGRVQSVVVKIIVDKENEIKKSVSNPYILTKGLFKIMKKKVKGVLYNMKLKKNYMMDNIYDSETWLKTINSEVNINITKIVNKKSIRKPSPPFITSTLQQDASSKLRFNVKKTMMIAQKLYEAGHITYMRTDSTNLSLDCRNNCRDYIIKNYGKKYSSMKNYTKNKKGAQEAHEAIRPTNIKNKTITNMMKDNIRLYELIWKRTVASQMSNAIINIMNIDIDFMLDKKSILPKNSIFLCSLENIIFDGFLILYNNIESDEEKQSGTVDILVGGKVKLKELTISEEYTKPPYRYNEANIVKYLEKKGIGRPSTYASIISKIMDRNYIEVKNIDGVKKESNILLLNSKYKISKKKKDLFIGKEKNKMVPTEMGNKVNNFMETNFNNIMMIDFTTKFEEYLDMVAEGKAKWYNVLKKYYNEFSPNINKLKGKKNAKGTILGSHKDMDVVVGEGKYGPYIHYDNKYTAVKDINITLKEAIDLLSYPKYLGKLDKKKVYLHIGRYGKYCKVGTKNVSLKDFKGEITLENIKNFFSKDRYALKTFNIDDMVIHIKNGQYGPYIQIIKNNKKVNKSLSKNIKIETITEDRVREYIKEI
jgi:DNA topoisomerase I